MPTEMVRVFRVITRLNIGGPAQHAVTLVNHLNGPEWSSTLVTGRIDSQEGDMSDLADRHGIRSVVVPTLRNGAGPGADIASLVALYRLFRRERPTIVHLHLFKARLLGGIAARLAGVPIVVESFHGTIFAGYYRPAVSRVIIWIERILARMMHAAVAVSQEVAEELIRRKVAGPEKIRVIPVGLELERFVQAADSRGLCRGAMGWNDADLLVGLVGRLVPIKGVRFFVAAAEQVAGVIPHARFVIVGDGPERDALERQTREMGLDHRFAFLGWRRDLEWLYPDLDVVVLSSLNEGTPVSVIEAMAAGRPVVATRVGGVADVVQDGVTGLLVPPRDPSAMAGAIIRLLGDADERRRMGTAARRSVVSRFAAARMTCDMETLYREMVRTRVLSSTAASADPT